MANQTTLATANLGFPRIGLHRELKFAVENYWTDDSKREQLQVVAREVRKTNWLMQKKAGIESSLRTISRSTITCWTRLSCLAWCLPAMGLKARTSICRPTLLWRAELNRYTPWK
jgi:hypothetical protein